MIHLVAIYVEYDPAKFGHPFRQFQEYVGQCDADNITYLVVDNATEGRGVISREHETWRLEGDDREREFSGWQRGLDWLEQEIVGYDAVLLSNEAFSANGPSFLQDCGSLGLVQKSLKNMAAVGRIDTFGTPISALDYDLTRWICSSALFMPRQVVKDLGPLITLSDAQLSTLIPVHHPQRALLGEKKVIAPETSNGTFSLQVEVGESPVAFVRIEIDKTFVPRRVGLGEDSRELGLRLHQLKFDDRTVPVERYLEGLYTEGGTEAWMANAARIDCRGMSGSHITLEATVPKAVLARCHQGGITVSLASLAGDYFQPNGPISAALKSHLLNWLTVRWHSRFEPTSNWQLFRTKARAILNEMCLSARIVESGYSLREYGDKKYY